MPADRHDLDRPGRLVATSRGRTGIAVGVISLVAAALLWMNPAVDLAAAGIGAQRLEPTATQAVDPAKVPVTPPATPERCRELPASDGPQRSR